MPTIQIGCEPNQTNPLAHLGCLQLASYVGISFVAVVQPRLTQGKCLKDDWGVMLRVVLGDLLKDLPSEKEGTKSIKIGIVSEKKISLVLKKGRIKLTE